MARSTRRHPGVSWVKPNDKTRAGWRVQYRDPDTGKLVRKTPDVPVGNARQREDYAVRLHDRLRQRREALDRGAPKLSGSDLGEALDRYFDAQPQLRPGAVAAYRIPIDRFADWCADNGIESCDDLDRAALMCWRESAVQAGRLTTKRSGKRGEKKGSRQRKSPHTINGELRKVGTALRYLADCDLFARVSHDDIRRACKPLPAPVERKDYLKTAELKRLFAAVKRHDAQAVRRRETWTGQRPFDPVGPFLAFVLLTGMRRGEALALTWDDLDLDALDANGNKVGEIYVRASGSKTSKARTVGLEVSPALRRLLAAQRLATGGKGKVWPQSKGGAVAAHKRLVEEFGAPERFNWQILRVTCGTYLSNAPAIYGSASAFFSARQLGHSVEVAQKHYVGLIRGIPKDAHDLESAMQIGKEVDAVIGAVTTPTKAKIRKIR